MSEIVRIAIADDHLLVRSGMAMILRENPNFVVVQQAENGRVLLDGIEDSKPDVVLLDLDMPVLGGADTLTEIKKSYAHIRVLILTMHNNEAFIIKLMELGANGYLLKDTDPKEVVKAINKVVEDEFYFSEEVSKAMLHAMSNPDLKNSEGPRGHGLTEREVEVLQLICKERTTAEIGDALFLSPKTIEGYRKALLIKTEARNMAGLVLFAIKHGLHVEE
jgi:DNA-binding NarL/FixJ family response regulator